MTASMQIRQSKGWWSYDPQMLVCLQRQLKRAQRADDRPFERDALPVNTVRLSPPPENDAGVFAENFDPVDVFRKQVRYRSQFDKRIRFHIAGRHSSHPTGYANENRPAYQSTTSYDVHQLAQKRIVDCVNSLRCSGNKFAGRAA